MVSKPALNGTHRITGTSRDPVFDGTDDEYAPPPCSAASEFKAGRVEFLWSPRVPFGGITWMNGDTNAGKTAVIFDLVARYTSGREMPGEKRKHRKKDGKPVIMLIERDPSTILIPRLKAAGANLDMVRFYGREPGKRYGGAPQLPGCVPELGRALDRFGAKLLVLDPIGSMMTDGGTSGDSAVRMQLEPLNEMLEDLGVAALVTGHLNKKKGESALYRCQGNNVIGSCTLGVLLCSWHPAKDGRRVLSHVKTSAGAMAPAVGYTIEPHEEACRLKWLGEEKLNADELLAGDDEAGERDKLEDAMKLLRQAIGGGRKGATEMIEEAEGCGIGARTLRKAKAMLRVKSHRIGRSNPPKWEWGPPPGGWPK